MSDTLKLSRRIAATGPLSQLIEAEVRPGPKAASDESLVAYLRATGATAYHRVGTCRIGTDAAQSVVDPQLRVHGLTGLRVADASVMPTIASTNTKQSPPSSASARLSSHCVIASDRVRRP